ncbi:MAG: hypothetical protein D6683_02450 [Actinomyces sp.]|nr:MAG: hypothetical protein D6683_02450 [Actinomyces sp.]
MQAAVVVLLGAIGLTLIASAASTALLILRPPEVVVEQWRPLGPYPVQRILGVTDTSVVVEGVRCASEPHVKVRTSMSWVRLDPPGYISPATVGVVDLDFTEGCRTRTFDNTIPADVREADSPGAVWVIAGEDVPIDTDGTVGASVYWSSEPFVLTPLAPAQNGE